MEGVNIFEEKEKRTSTDLWCGTALLGYVGSQKVASVVVEPCEMMCK